MQRTIITFLIFLLFYTTGLCQTVVRLSRPLQSEEHIAGWTLFDESLPAGIPTAIGTIGYDIYGGYLPYSYQWLEDETVIAEGEVALIVPSTDHRYALRITDRYNCTVVIPINISASMPGEKSSLKNDLTFWYELTRKYLYLSGDLLNEKSVRISLYDINGRLILERLVHAEATIPVSLSPGVYLIYTRSGETNMVEKVIVQ